MEIKYYKELDSTHKFLLKSLKNGTIKPPILIVADEQSDGVGSRGNRWISKKGNLFLSFCVKLKQLPKDLPIQSASIYFSYILKEVLNKKGSKTWLKWPNDFYIDDKKIGGTITIKLDNFIVCSIGLNLTKAPENFGFLDIQIDRDLLIEEFIKNLKKNTSWKKVFSKYKVEFQKAKKFSFHLAMDKVFLKDAVLNEDGSISLNNKTIYSVR